MSHVVTPPEPPVEPPAAALAVPVDPSLSWEPIALPEGGESNRWVNGVRAVLAWLAIIAFIAPSMLLVALGVDPDWVVTGPIRWWARVELWLLGLRLEVEGVENLPTGPFILMSNHQSVLDVFTYASYFDRPIFYVLKKEFGRIPLLGWFLRQTDQIFLDRKDREKAILSLRRGVEKLHDGKMTVIFPEGTRTAPGTLGAFKKGPFHLALQARVPVVPVTTLNSGLLLPTRSLKFRRGTIRLVVSPPIDTTAWAEETLDEHVEAVRQAIAGPLGAYRASLGYRGNSRS